MRLLSMLILTLFLFGCANDPCSGNKEQFLKNYEALVQKAKTSNHDYSAKEWENYDRKFEKMTECSENFDLTIAEKVSFGMDAAKYAYYRYGVGIAKELENEETRDRISERLSEQFKEMNNINVDVNEEEIKKLAKEWDENPEIQEFFEELGGEAEKFGKQIEKITKSSSFKDLLKKLEKEAGDIGKHIEDFANDPEMKEALEKMEKNLEKTFEDLEIENN